MIINVNLSFVLIITFNIIIKRVPRVKKNPMLVIEICKFSNKGISINNRSLTSNCSRGLDIQLLK